VAGETVYCPISGFEVEVLGRCCSDDFKKMPGNKGISQTQEQKSETRNWAIKCRQRASTSLFGCP